MNLTPSSKHIVKHFLTNKNLQFVPHTTQSYKFKQVVKKILRITNRVLCNDIHIVESRVSCEPFLREKYLETVTVSPNIRNFAYREIKKMKGKWYGHTFFAYPNTKLLCTGNVNEGTIKNILMRSNVLRLAVQLDDDQKVTIIYIPSPYKKQLPNIKQPLESKHINSGLTCPGVLSLIFRKEEATKVLLHELIHQFGLSNSFTKFNTRVGHYFKYSKKNRDLLIDEVITETMVCIYHSIMNAIELGEFEKRKVCKLVDQLMIIERNYGVFQSAKLLKFFGFRNIDEFIVHPGNHDWLEQPSGPIVEVITPAIIEYFFLRSALLFKPERALEAITFPLEDTMEIIALSVNDEDFKNAINKAINVWIPSLMGSLRMSAISLQRRPQNELIYYLDQVFTLIPNLSWNSSGAKR